ncbi:class I SAM-dependent methyltransferase [Plantactinospora sp. CA-290183]|uniref:class I SAM-dependent methyltransferase n=1 Tax=Plantactinospora sp. CA-290183 TaxID=3240006 RepID=UPI003D8EAD68
MERPHWVVETMGVEPDDHLLEVGCGSGYAVSLVCQRLDAGRIVALDRSARMTRLAIERNAGYVGAGRAEIRCAAFEAADLPAGQFDKIFSVNVSLFWLGDPDRAIERVKRLLAPRATLYVFAERATRASAAAIGAKAGDLLAAHGLHPRTTTATSRRGHALVCVSGTLA